MLVKGKPRCTVQLHPDDAARLGLADGDPAVVASRVGQVTMPVEVTDAIVPGVVSIPHGWGHDGPGVQLRVAREHAGVNSNVLTDEELLDPVSGNAVLNGIPVSVSPRPPDRSELAADRRCARIRPPIGASAPPAGRRRLEALGPQALACSASWPGTRRPVDVTTRHHG